MSDGQKNVVVVDGKQTVFTEKDGGYEVDGTAVTREVFDTMMREVRQRQRHEKNREAGMLFDHLEKVWLPRLVRAGSDLDRYVERMDPFGQDRGKGDRVQRYRIYTNDNSYVITASIKADGGTYLGCVTSVRKPRAGETYTRGGDLPDGEFNHDTWFRILNAIIGRELEVIRIRTRSGATREGTHQADTSEDHVEKRAYCPKCVLVQRDHNATACERCDGSTNMNWMAKEEETPLRFTFKDVTPEGDQRGGGDGRR